MSARQIGSAAIKSGPEKSQRYSAFNRVSAGGKQLYGYYTDVKIPECGIVCRLLYRTSGGPAEEGTTLAVKGSISFVYPHVLISSTGIQRLASPVLRGVGGNSVPRVYFAGTLTGRVAAVRNGDASKFTFQVSVPGPVQTRVRCTCLRASKLIVEAPRLFEGHYVAIVGYLGEQAGGTLDVVVVSFACLIYPEELAKRAREIWPGRVGGDEVRVVGFYLPVNDDDDAEGSTDDEARDRLPGGGRNAPRTVRSSSKLSGTTAAIMFPGALADTPARIQPAQLAVVHTTRAYSSPHPSAHASPSSYHVPASTSTGALASPGPPIDPDTNMEEPPKVEYSDASSMMIAAAPYATQVDPSVLGFGSYPNVTMQSVPVVNDVIPTTHAAVGGDALASQSSLYGALGPTFHELQSPSTGGERVSSEFGGDGMDVDPPRFAATASLGFAVDGPYAEVQAEATVPGVAQGEQPDSLLFAAAAGGGSSNLLSSPHPPIAGLETSSWDPGARSLRSDASLTPSPTTHNVNIAEASLVEDAPSELFSGPEDLPQSSMATGVEAGPNGDESFSKLMHDAFDHYRWAAENGPDDWTSTMDPDDLFETYLDHE